MKARVNTFLNMRTGTPEILPHNNPDNAFFKPNDVVEIVDTIFGETYKGNDVWHKLDTGILISNFGVDIDKDRFFKENKPLSTDNDLSKKIILNTPVGKNGRGIVIGVLDSGIDVGHPSLKAAVESEENFLSGPDTVSITNNHGTNIAGLLVGNDEAISGLTIDAKIKSYRVIKNNNSVDEFAFKKALENIFKQSSDIDILNLSLEIIESSFPFFLDLLNNIIQKNVIIVVAGNIGNTEEINSLANLKNVIVVGAFASDKFNSIPKSCSVSFLNTPILTTSIFENEKKHSLFEDSSAYTAIVTGIIGRFLSNKYIIRSDRYTEVIKYLNSCSFDIEINKLPFKIYKNESN